jgi:hypothetical protein
MELPVTLPDWLPDWAFLLLALPVLLYALVFMMMPFSVFGVKSRLEALEAQIALLHDEIRVLGMREAGVSQAPRKVAEPMVEDVPDFGRLKRTVQPVPAEPLPPAPPAPPERAPLAAIRERPYINELRAAGRRVEPRLE